MIYTRKEALAIYRILGEIAVADEDFHKSEEELLVACGVHFGLSLDDHDELIKMSFFDASLVLRKMSRLKKDDVAQAIKAIIKADMVVHDKENIIAHRLWELAQIKPYYLI